jgi:hypothetical protein
MWLGVYSRTKGIDCVVGWVAARDFVSVLLYFDHKISVGPKACALVPIFSTFLIALRMQIRI